MEKTKKMIVKIVPIVLVLMIVFMTNIHAASPINTTFTSGDNKISTVTTATEQVWNTVVVILQIAAIGAIVFAGVRYMFASADTKADIKKQMIVLVVGAVLVFGATTVASLISNATNQIEGGVVEEKPAKK